MKTKIHGYTKLPGSVLKQAGTILDPQMGMKNMLNLTDKVRSYGFMQKNLFGKVASGKFPLTQIVLKANNFNPVKEVISECSSLQSSYDSQEEVEDKPFKVRRSKSAFATFQNYIQNDQEGKTKSLVPINPEEEEGKGMVSFRCREPTF